MQSRTLIEFDDSIVATDRVAQCPTLRSLFSSYFIFVFLVRAVCVFPPWYASYRSIGVGRVAVGYLCSTAEVLYPLSLETIVNRTDGTRKHPKTSLFLLLRSTIINWTYGPYKNSFFCLLLLTRFGPIYYCPLQWQYLFIFTVLPRDKSED